MESQKRFWEIDSLRGIAIISMIIFHALCDLAFFGDFRFKLYSGLLLYFQRFIAITFIFLVGVSLNISLARINPSKRAFLKYLKRGLTIFGWGLVITLVTWLFLKDGFIIFGILHFIGLSVILAYPFLRLKYSNLFIGILLIALGICLREFLFDFKWLMWLGFTPMGIYTVDYFPLLPWFGIVLIGIFFSKVLYKEGKRAIALPELGSYFGIRQLQFLGRHSLFVYIAHQPLLIALLAALGIIEIL